MAVQLNDLLKKAQQKGITANFKSLPAQAIAIRPWESDNTLDNISDNKLDNKDSKNNTSDNILDNKDNRLDSTSDNRLDNTLDSIKTRALDNRLDNTLDNTIIRNTLTTLNGHGLAVLCYVLKICVGNSSLETGAINTMDMAYAIGCNYRVAKICIERLVKKRLLIRYKGRSSSGGYINLGLAKEIKKIALELKLDNILDNILDNRESGVLDNTLGNILDNKIPPSSISYINKTNTTDLPDEWESINYESLQHIGFSKSQLLQLYSKKLNHPEIIQESINHFAYGLENSEKVKAYPEPLNVLMGVLRKGQAWTESNYESVQDKELRLYLERKKVKEQNRNKMIKEIFDSEFNTWFSTQSDDELKKILPNVSSYSRESKFFTSAAEVYFQKTFGEEIQGKINNLIKT